MEQMKHQNAQELVDEAESYITLPIVQEDTDLINFQIPTIDFTEAGFF